MKYEQPFKSKCPQMQKDFETLKKSFPYFDSSLGIDFWQQQVCDLCQTEWQIPRFMHKPIPCLSSKDNITLGRPPHPDV